MKSSTIRKIAGALVLANMVSVMAITGCNNKAAVDPSGIPEVTEEPAKSVTGIFAAIGKDYYVPFQNPDHSYCTINEGYGAPLREQGIGGCYSYAAVTSMQSNYLQKSGELIDINPIDIIYRIYEAPEKDKNGQPQYPKEKFYLDTVSPLDLGGDALRVTGALCADPLNGYLISETAVLGAYNATVKGTPTITIDDVKAAIKNHGAICLGINYKKDCKIVNGFYTQNHPDNVEDMDHIATIVGWDDDFPADCFTIPASQNGAWLVQNSFGPFWGNAGYYWVSYDTPLPDLISYSVTKEYSSAISYGRFPAGTILSTDVVAMLEGGKDPETITLEDISDSNDLTIATVFEKKGNVAAIGIWTTVPDQPYTIEILDGEFGKVLASTSGTFDTWGYHTVKLDTPVSVKKFTVVLKIAGEYFFEGGPADSVRVSTAIRKTEAHYEAKTKPGRSFVKIGEEWVDVTDPTLISRLGIEEMDNKYLEAGTIGDPCITVLYK